MDFTCNLACPAFPSDARCCGTCSISRKKFLNKDNEIYWTDDAGFWGQDGCKLPRKALPSECKEFNCKSKTWVVVRQWLDGDWRDLAAVEVQKGQEVIGIQTRPIQTESQLVNKYWDKKKEKWVFL